MKMSYDQQNKIREKYKAQVESLSKENETLKEKLSSSEEEIKELRKKLYDAGEGKGEVNRLKKEKHKIEVDYKTLQNQYDLLSGEKLIKTFKPERQQLIKNIKNLHFNVSIYNYLALRFQNGLDNVIELAALIKEKTAKDMDFYTFVFRDNIVGLLEKMLRVVLAQKEESATKYLVKLINGVYKFPKDYYQRIPELKKKECLVNILALINLQTTGYHGTKMSLKHIIINKNTNEVLKTDRFLNLSSHDQLDAIFTLLKLMYDIFTNKENEQNLMVIATSWYKTI